MEKARSQKSDFVLGDRIVTGSQHPTQNEFEQMKILKDHIMRYLLIVAIAIAICGCATVKRDWQEANRQATVESYEHFLQKHPDANQASQAKLRLAKLQAGEAWSKASSADTIAGYKDFLNKYPQSTHANQASTRLKQLETERDWAQTRSSGTVAAYKEFLQKHPGSKEAAGARQELERLEAERDWKSTQEANSAGAYQEFLKARQELERLWAERDWKSTQEANSAGAYQEFLKNHSTSKYAAEAQKRLTSLQVAAASRVTGQTQSGEMDLPYELMPLSKALETGRISGLAANNLSIGQSMHHDTMRRLIDDMEARRKSLGTGDDLRETLDVLLREVREVRNVARHQILAFDKGSGNIFVISKAYTDLLEKGFRGYGVVLPSMHWGYMPPFAREASRVDWQIAKASRIDDGRWAGAYLLNGKQILLPGFQAIDELSGSATSESIAVELRLRLDKGRTYYEKIEVKQRLIQTLPSRQHVIDLSMGRGQRLDVLDIDNQGNVRIRYTLNWLKSKQTGSMGEVTYDSARQTTSQAGMEALAGLLGQTYIVGVNPKGEVLYIEGAEEVREAVVKKIPAGAAIAMGALFECFLSKKGIHEETENMLANFPDKAVETGQSWSKKRAFTMDNFRIISEVKWILQKREASTAVIAMTSSLRTNSYEDSMEVNGAKLKYDLSGTQDGTIRMEEATGLVVSEQSHRQLKGEVKAGDPSRGQPVITIRIVVDSIVKREMSDKIPDFEK